MLEQLAVDAVLDGVHHLALGEDRAALLVDAALEEERVEGNLVQRLQHLWWSQAGGEDEGRKESVSENLDPAQHTPTGAEPRGL